MVGGGCFTLFACLMSVKIVIESKDSTEQQNQIIIKYFLSDAPLAKMLKYAMFLLSAIRLI